MTCANQTGRFCVMGDLMLIKPGFSTSVMMVGSQVPHCVWWVWCLEVRGQISVKAGFCWVMLEEEDWRRKKVRVQTIYIYDVERKLEHRGYVHDIERKLEQRNFMFMVQRQVFKWMVRVIKVWKVMMQNYTFDLKNINSRGNFFT